MSQDDWKVYYVYNCRFTKPPKNKYIITFKLRDDQYLGLFINSKLTNFASRSVRLKSCYAEISCETNTYLSHDSFVNCADANVYKDSELIRVEGYVCEEAKKSIIKAMVACSVMKYKWRMAILGRYPTSDFL